MNVLLTGGTGFLGREIKEFLSEFHLSILSRSGGDISCDLAYRVPILSDSYDLVIHAAGKAHSIPHNDSEKTDFYSVNVHGTQNLLKGFEKSGLIPRYFVFISTVAVYGRREGVDIAENSELLAKDPYGLSKIKAELILQEWCSKNNVVLTVIRPPLIIGDKLAGNMRDLVKSIYKGFYFNIDGGKARKSMVLAKDVAQFILLAYKDGGIFVLTDGYHPSFYELTNVIAKSLGKGRPKNIPLFLGRFLALLGDKIGEKSPFNTNKLSKITSTLTFSDTNARNKYGWKSKDVLTYLCSQQINL